MRWDNFCRRVTWLFTVVLVLVTGRLTVADDQQEASDKVRAARDRALTAERLANDKRLGEVELDLQIPAPSAYWLGVDCGPASNALRAQLKLPEDQGIVVHSVSPESPAAAAGIEKFDVLLSVEDEPLETVADLRQAVADAKDEQELAINLVRRGEALTVTVKPNKRPIRESELDLETIVAPEHDGIRLWLEKIHSGRLVRIPQRLRIFRPGTVIDQAFPDDLSVRVTKDGQKPAKVVVELGDEKWEVTEDALGELPEKVRAHVQGLLGRIPGPGFTKTITGEIERQLKDFEPPAIPELPQFDVGPLQERLERRIDEINKQLEKLSETLKDLRLDRPETDEEENEVEGEDEEDLDDAA